MWFSYCLCYWWSLKIHPNSQQQSQQQSPHSPILQHVLQRFQLFGLFGTLRHRTLEPFDAATLVLQLMVHLTIFWMEVRMVTPSLRKAGAHGNTQDLESSLKIGSSKAYWMTLRILFFFHLFSVFFSNGTLKSPPRQTGPANLSAVHSHQPVPGCVAEPLYLAVAAHRSASSAHPGPNSSHEMYGTHYLIITFMISTITFRFMCIYIYTDM